MGLAAAALLVAVQPRSFSDVLNDARIWLWHSFREAAPRVGVAMRRFVIMLVVRS
jgi:hypothetical protein